ncbi:hypothetical protein [Dehalococcoides sp.]|uniref:hypothetical protein n=1 Tax=Dehalococcoides sp. TaxID=1966486 RepID=UPI002ACB06F1|nr:hypothetical protein [Dehalococcoides sp.]
MSKNINSMIDDLVGTLTDPIIVYPGGWGDSLPEWLKNAITLERLAENMKASKGEQPTGTDAEACVYLNTASLTMPIDGDWSQIYLYVAGKTYTRWRKGEMPKDIKVDSLTKQQTTELNRLKEWLYLRRTTARQEQKRSERRQQKEEEVAKRESEQPALFDF